MPNNHTTYLSTKASSIQAFLSLWIVWQDPKAKNFYCKKVRKKKDIIILCTFLFSKLQLMPSWYFLQKILTPRRNKTVSDHHTTNTSSTEAY